MNDAEVSIKFKNKVTNEKALEKYAETLTKINSVLSGINTGAAKQLQSGASSVNQIDADVSDLNTKVGTAFNVLAITKYAGAIKKLGAGFTSLAKQSMDYLENFNLFQVAFNGNYNSAEKFVNKMSEMYGLDESWITQTVGKFKQLTNAMNLTAETGEKVSKLLTQMSLDISSLYNVDIDKAASTLSSAMAGQTKPIRGVTGGDITQATLQTTLDNLGIEAAVNQLSFAEKRLLIIISLTKQLNASIGDMGRTIESPANQLRVMNEQWERLTRAVGNVFLPILSKILPYLNAILMVLTEIISIIASLVGFKTDDFDYFGGAVEDAWDLDEGLKSAGSSAKKLKQGLRGFDKLNVITTPSSGGGGGGASAGGVNPKIMDAFNSAFDEYQNKLKNVKMRATEIRDAIMEWLGFTKIINEETGDISFKLKDGYSNFKLIVGLITTLVGFKLVKGIAGLVTGTSKLGKLLGTGGLYNTIKKLVEAMKVLGAKDGLLYVFYDSKLGKVLTTLTSGFGKLAAAIGVSSGALLGIVAAIVAVAAAFVYAYKTNDEFKKKVDTLVKTIKNTFKPILQITKTLIESIAKVAKSFLDNVLKPLINTIMKILTPIMEVIIDVLQEIFEKISSVFDKLKKDLEPIIKDITTFLTETLFPIIGKIFGVIGKIFEALAPILGPILKLALETLVSPIMVIADIISVIYDIVSWLYNKLVKPFLDYVIDKINKKVIPAINSIVNVVDKIKKAIQKVVDWWNNLSFNKKVVSVEASSGGGSSSGGGRHYASGGLPPVGQIFVANEKGPELIGQIGGQSFVANQNQVVDLLDRKLGEAKSNPINLTLPISVGSKEVAKVVIQDLQELAKTNGKPITIGN